MASVSDDDVRKAHVAFAAVTNEAKEEVLRQTRIEIEHLDFCKIGDDLVVDLFMEMAASSPYVGLVGEPPRIKDRTLLWQFCNCPGYWLAINTTDYHQAKTLFDTAHQNVVGYLETKFDELVQEAHAKGEELLGDGEEVDEYQNFDSLNDITEFKDFDIGMWFDAREMIDKYEQQQHRPCSSSPCTS